MHERSDELGDSGDSDGVDGSENADRGRILGTTTVAQGMRITLIADVREAFADQGIEVEEGDTIVYRLCDGQIVVESA